MLAKSRILAQVREEALPDGLHEVHRVELGPQLLRQPGPDHHLHLALEPSQEFADRRRIVGSGPPHQLGEVVIVTHDHLDINGPSVHGAGLPGSLRPPRPLRLSHHPAPRRKRSS